ncbi:MAG: 4'-phosphopantetheinyl transferase superfamily protein, partial [bacterium]
MPVGNDIVDLRDPESDPASLHARYLKRVFTAQERRAIGDRPDPVELWSRWAAKEAAYKALAGDLSSGRSELVFSPRAFITELDPRGAGPYRNGWVVHQDPRARLPVRVYCLEGAVHAVASTAGELERAQL